MKSHRFLATLVLVVLAAAPLALAQGTKPKKKGAKGAASASASAAASAPPTDTAPATPPPPPEPEPAPSASGSASAELPTTPPESSDSANTSEEPGKRYYFIGLRYRGNLIPQFLENLFVNDGATVFSNSIGAELDMRTDGHSTIPWIQYSNYNTGDILFYEKGKPDDASNYSDVKSGLSAIYLGLDELWSTPLDEAHHWDFEYGFGVGIGAVFGSLTNDWVYVDPNGSLHGTNGRSYTQCPNTNPPPVAQPAGNNGNPCAAVTHNNATDIKVGGYQEKNWFNGGSIPVIFPHIALPILSIRYKPVKQFEARFGLGFSITGLWFGISGDYGLEKPEGESSEPAPKAKPKKDSYLPSLQGTF